MTQRVFIDKLMSCLSGKVSTGTIQENVAYYNQYFATEIRMGKSEEEVCQSLGSPQLIAKGILEAEKFQSGGAYQSDYRSQVDEEKDYRSTSCRWSENVRGFHLPGWLGLIIVICLFFSIISLAITVFSALAPIIIPVCIVLLIMHIFKNNL